MKKNTLALKTYRELYEKYGQKPDLLERRLYYFFSLRLLRLFADRRITSNQVTLAGFIIGVTGALLLLPPFGYAVSLVGLLFLNLANIADALDGQLARYRKQFSRLGWFWDVASDQVKLILVTLVLIFSEPNTLLQTAGWLFLVVFALHQILCELIQKYGKEQIWQLEETSPVNDDVFSCYRFFSMLDDLRLRLGVGLLTVGEFYLLVSLGVIFNQTGLLLVVLFLYACVALVVIIGLELSSISYLQPLLARKRARNAVFYIYGTGAKGREVHQRLSDAGVTPRLFLDSNPDMSGMEIHGLPVVLTEEINPEQLPPDRIILVASFARYAICRKLRRLGFKRRNIVIL